ncbi:CCA tRNA nucleotidyltransferase [Rickettsiales endosymbiont of Stachyamoeba lipophora]|uniref:CCA tRNA nucleotidyltransferase n=1 Tax=Rickettsiales endosymbiont of Stachyamoeba lipophora TaxID=2486578 RepID=UPI000F652C7F|nr:CCA tRNA nucleotidyltransferase [Rickettsiales endosymbiont of Stachyamoeba lipophora]AZL15285.1 CCA tRNA nucleotidyltransferase [Rickettsiales endosymbiont of Stachyamoeba lipophora]
MNKLLVAEFDKLYQALLPYKKHFKMVGGCVRDLLAGLPINDIDLATDYKPDELTELLTKLDIKYHTGGIKHGTVSAIIDHKIFEITTLRIDKFCDGRHAEVEFIDSWEMDASRRDFTFNALYMDFEGNIYDYFGGKEDLAEGNLQFIGSAEQRIAEDHLRLLRAIRFWQRYGKQNFRADFKNILRNNANNLLNLSGERIYQEFSKIITADHLSDALRLMKELNFEKYLGFKIIDNFELIEQLKDNNSINLILISILKFELENINNFIARCKLSSKQSRYLLELFGLIAEKKIEDIQFLLFYKEKEMVIDWLKFLEISHKKSYQEYINQVCQYIKKPLPFNGQEVAQLYGLKGKEISDKIKQFEKIWIEANFLITKEELIKTAK